MTTKEDQEARANQADEDQPDSNTPPTDDQQEQNGPPTTWDEIFQHPRFKELNQRAKEAEAEMEKQRQAAEQAKRKELEEQSKWQELYEEEQKSSASLKEQIANLESQRIESTKRRAIEAAARSHEPPFLESAVDDVLEFADIADVTIDDDGNVQGADTVVKAIADKRPHWLDSKRHDPGSPPGRKPGPKSTEWSGPRIKTL